MRSFMSNSIQSSSAADRARRNIRGEPKSPAGPSFIACWCRIKLRSAEVLLGWPLSFYRPLLHIYQQVRSIIDSFVHLSYFLYFQKMTKINKWITTDENHKDCNSFLMTVLCHGNKDDRLLDANRRKGWDIEDIVGDLSVVTTLTSKPKVILIQACRGSTCYCF